MSAANFDLVFGRVGAVYQIFSIDNVKDLLIIIIETFKDDKVFLRFINANDVHDLVFVCDFEGQDLLADFAVNFIKLKHDLTFVHLPLTFCF